MIRGDTIKVLDKGYVRYVDHLGSDEFIVETARVSTRRGFVSWDPYKRCRKCDLLTFANGISCSETSTECAVTEPCGPYEHDWQNFPRGDLGVLEYMYKNRHTSPFEFGDLVIDVKVPMDCWRQWIRHRTAKVSEYSTRYSPAIDETAATAPDKWRGQSTVNRQGSDGYLDESLGWVLSSHEAALHREARLVYEERLNAGVAKEQARKDLPLSTYTEARWKIDIHNLLHFLSLRLDPHAQEEIRSFAQAIAEIVKELWPRTYALFEEHTLGAVRFSKTEAMLLAHILDSMTREGLNAIAMTRGLRREDLESIVRVHGTAARR